MDLLGIAICLVQLCHFLCLNHGQISVRSTCVLEQIQMELQQSKGYIKDETEWSTIYIKSSNIGLEGVEVVDTMSPDITIP